MAQMRIKDQDLILAQVKEKIDAQGLNALQARKDVVNLSKQLDTRIETITDLIAQQQELEKQIKDLRDDMQKRVKDFNNDNNFEEIYSYSKNIFSVKLRVLIQRISTSRKFRYSSTNSIFIDFI